MLLKSRGVGGHGHHHGADPDAVPLQTFEVVEPLVTEVEPTSGIVVEPSDPSTPRNVTPVIGGLDGAADEGGPKEKGEDVLRVSRGHLVDEGQMLGSGVKVEEFGVVGMKETPKKGVGVEGHPRTTVPSRRDQSPLVDRRGVATPRPVSWPSPDRRCGAHWAGAPVQGMQGMQGLFQTRPDRHS